MALRSESGHDGNRVVSTMKVLDQQKTALISELTQIAVTAAASGNSLATTPILFYRGAL